MSSKKYSEIDEALNMAIIIFGVNDHIDPLTKDILKKFKMPRNKCVMQ